MIPFETALKLVVENSAPLRSRKADLVEACGLRLAAPILSQQDTPPFRKSIVDGIAIRYDDYSSGLRIFDVVDLVTAGDTPSPALLPKQAARVMTGARVPDQADIMVMVEETVAIDNGTQHGQVEIRTERIKQGQNIQERGALYRSGEPILNTRDSISPGVVGLLAELGEAEVEINPKPSLAVLVTGSELVSYRELPTGTQIRNSNGPMIIAQSHRYCESAVNLGHVADNRHELARLVQRGLESDLFVLTGGVSMGIADYVPQVLAEAGVVEIFHKVNLKPGKPIWFGKKERPGGGTCLVFGLPGNPVSSFVCFELFVRLALERMAGSETADLNWLYLPIGDRFENKSDRNTFWPARLVQRDDKTFVSPLPWKGSADLKTLAMADALIYLPVGLKSVTLGDIVRVVLIQR